MPRRLWGGLLIAALAGCGSSETGDGGDAQPILDGAYYSTEGGPIAWRVFKGTDYVTWGSAPACNDVTLTAPSDCEHHGTFVLDARSSTLSMTDSVTHQTIVHGISIRKLAESGTLVAQSRVIGDSRTLTTSSSLVAGEISLSDGPSTQLIADWRTNLYAACQLLTILVAPGDSEPKPQLPPPPAAITRAADCPKKKA